MTGRKQCPEDSANALQRTGTGLVTRSEIKSEERGGLVFPRVKDPREQIRPEESGLLDILLPALFTFVILFCVMQICWGMLHRNPAGATAPKAENSISAFAG